MTLRYEDLVNAGNFCTDNSQLTVGMLQPFSDLYFKFDQDENGVIEPRDMLKFFRKINTDGDRFVSRDEF